MKFETYAHKLLIDPQQNFHENPCKDACASCIASTFVLLISYCYQNWGNKTVCWCSWCCSQWSRIVLQQSLWFIPYQLSEQICLSVLLCLDCSEQSLSPNICVNKGKNNSKKNFSQIICQTKYTHSMAILEKHRLMNTFKVSIIVISWHEINANRLISLSDKGRVNGENYNSGGILPQVSIK